MRRPLLILLAFVPFLASAAEPAADRFEKQVLAYESADKASPPPPGAILLAGDSQFFRWKTVQEDLSGYTVVNRGIDSFQMHDLLRHLDRLVLPHKPRLIILHVGGNDVHNGKTAEKLLAEFQEFVARVHATLPGVPIAFSSITPGPGRWEEADRRKAANKLLKDYIATQPGLHFIDLWDAMLTADGKPREDIWVEDRVHPNHAGYLIRVKIMRPLLGTPDKENILPNVTLHAAEVIKLWPGAAPGDTAKIGPEYVLPERPRPFDQLADVSVPTLSVFSPDPEKRNGTAVLVIPGGGLERLAIEHEGYEVAEWLNAQGITAFLLKYRVPPRDPQQRWKAGLQDAQRAMGLIRANAAKWNLDMDAIGCLGFSAGAEINVLLSIYHAEPRQYSPGDDADKFSTRPDFNIAIYGGGFADLKSNALREDVAKRLTAGTPPMFIAHAFDDQALNSIILMNALKRANVASELHVFGAGGHGFGVRDSGLPLGHWRELCLNWLAWQGYLDPAAVRTFARDYSAGWTSGTATLPRLGAMSPASDLPTAFAAQRRVVRQAVVHGAAIAGYKGAFTSAAAQAAMGIAGPMHGVLFKSGRIEALPAPTIALEPNRPLFVETEIGYIMAVDIGTKLRLPRQALTAVEAMVPVIELPVNIGPLMGGAVKVADVIAANVGSSRYIVGAPVSPQVLNPPDTFPVTLKHDGQLLHETTGADVTGGQAQNLMTLINQIIDQGHVIHAGDLIICGALGGAKPAAKGSYTATWGRLGTIEFKLE
ncbi:MAG TPA: GDSL-type esterase/lipase family protein [Lacunisphaera sp.]|nr:GDSL-type esterase/lipase family protein [Lacunisphaera sp.]